ncbi:MAG TPA: hypothetical protein VGF39_18740 [Stellaceae bacterium]
MPLEQIAADDVAIVIPMLNEAAVMPRFLRLLAVLVPAQGTPPPLLYGNTYQFRVRLTDLTGQGPDSADAPAQEAATQRAQITFARHVPPKSLGLQTVPPLPADAMQPPGPISEIEITRPRITYPDALFTPRYGANADLAQAARQALLAQLGFDASGTPPTTKPAPNLLVATGLPDPDVTTVEIHVEVRALAGDTADDVSSDGGFVTLYRATRACSSLPPLPLPAPGTLLTPAQIAVDVPLDPLAIAFADVPDASDSAWFSGAGAGALPLPRGRDVRVTMTPIAEGPPGYFGTFVDPGRTPPTVGLTSKLLSRAPATDEPNLFAPPLDGSPALQAFSFRPVTEGDVVAGIMQRLAAQLSLRADGLVLFAQPGERVVFGCSGALKHQIAPDGSRITFASAAELLAKWSLIYQAVLQRDWTWDGLKGRTLVARSLDAAHNAIDIGTIFVPRVASADSLSGQPDRARTRIVFVHAIDPTAPNTVDGALPRPPIWLHATVEGSPADLEIDSEQQAVRLPVVVPPAEMPDIVSAGYALAPYEIGPDYSTTSPRARQLWLEFTAPPPPGLAILYRVLAYAPDPLLYHDNRLMGAAPPNDPALPLDPEYVRQVVPGQLPDEDGAEAMLPLIPATDSPTRFLLPLPPGIAPVAPELHGLWTYEFRFGRVTRAMVNLGYKARCCGAPRMAGSVGHCVWPACSIRRRRLLLRRSGKRLRLRICRPFWSPPQLMRRRCAMGRSSAPARRARPSLLCCTLRFRRLTAGLFATSSWRTPWRSRYRERRERRPSRSCNRPTSSAFWTTWPFHAMPG